MSKIKVSVSYVKEPTTKFEALMGEYELAKKLADEQVAYYKPLADAAEDAKIKAILEQLEVIEEYVFRLAQISKEKYVCVSCFLTKEELHNVRGEYFKVWSRGGSVHIEFNSTEVNYQNLSNHDKAFFNNCINLVVDWDRLGIYEKLEKDAFRSLKNITEQTLKEGEDQKLRLKQLTGDL